MLRGAFQASPRQNLRSVRPVCDGGPSSRQEEVMQDETSTVGREESVSAFAIANGTLICWLLFLGFGSAFLASYYSHIHYFPELKWEEAFSYLAAVSVLGGGVMAVYGMLLFVPGWIWSEFIIFDAELVENRPLCYSRGPGEQR